MFDKRRYLRNITFNWGAFAVSIAVGFFLSPFIVRHLGDAGYGYWSLVVTFTAYFGYFDLGIQSAVNHYITRHLGEDNLDALNRKANSALTMLLAGGILAALISAGASLFFTRFFHVRPEAVPAVRGALLLMGAVTAVKLPMSVFQSVLVGSQRFDLVSGTSLLVRLVNAGLVFTALRWHHGVGGMAVAVAAAQMLEGFAWMAFALKIAPGLRIRLFSFHPGAFRELFHYGIFNFLINLFGQFGAGFGTFIIGRKVAAEAVTHFSIGSEILPYMLGLVSAVVTPLLQVVIPMDVRGDFASMKTLLLTGTRYLFGFVCLIGLNLLLVGNAFLGQWMGAKYLDPLPYGSSGTVLIILTLANMAALSSSVPQQIMFGRRKNKLFAAYTLGETLGTVALAFFLVPRFGIVGMAVASLIPMALFEGFVIPARTATQVGSSLMEYWRKGLLPNLLVAAGVYAVSTALLPLLPQWGWATVFASFTLVSVLHLTAAYFFLVEGEHKYRLTSLIAGRAAWGQKPE